MNIYPYYDAKPEYYAQLTDGMSDAAKRGFANALAHHMMPVLRTSIGWWMTRHDKLLQGILFDLLDNDGRWLYNQTFIADKGEHNDK